MFVSFKGARATYDSEGNAVFEPRGYDIYVNVERIAVAYDHTLLIGDNQIRVMETGPEIRRIICEAEQIAKIERRGIGYD